MHTGGQALSGDGAGDPNVEKRGKPVMTLDNAAEFETACKIQIHVVREQLQEDPEGERQAVVSNPANAID